MTFGNVEYHPFPGEGVQSSGRNATKVAIALKRPVVLVFNDNRTEVYPTKEGGQSNEGKDITYFNSGTMNVPLEELNKACEELEQALIGRGIDPEAYIGSEIDPILEEAEQDISGLRKVWTVWKALHGWAAGRGGGAEMTPDECRDRVREAYPDPHTRIELTRRDMLRLWERVKHEPPESRLTKAGFPALHVLLLVEGRECVAFTVDGLMTDPSSLRECVERILGCLRPGGEALEVIEQKGSCHDQS